MAGQRMQEPPYIGELVAVYDHKKDFILGMIVGLSDDDIFRYAIDWYYKDSQVDTAYSSLEDVQLYRKRFRELKKKL
jgi:hypothetical protein